MAICVLSRHRNHSIAETLITSARARGSWREYIAARVERAAVIDYCSTSPWSRAGVPNLGYMYPQGYICISEGVHLRLSIEEQNIFAYDLFPNIYEYINEYSFQKSLYAYC